MITKTGSFITIVWTEAYFVSCSVKPCNCRVEWSFRLCHFTALRLLIAQNECKRKWHTPQKMYISKQYFEQDILWRERNVHKPFRIIFNLNNRLFSAYYSRFSQKDKSKTCENTLWKEVILNHCNPLKILWSICGCRHNSKQVSMTVFYMQGEWTRSLNVWALDS